MNAGDYPPPPPTGAMPLPPRKSGLSTGCVIALVVGLVVAVSIVVLIVLASIGVAAGQKVLVKARTLQAKAAMQGLAIAVKGYQTEYRHLPLANDPPPQRDGDAFDTADEKGRTLLAVLLAEDEKQNPRQIRFWEPPPSKSRGGGYDSALGLVDPWGKTGYRVLLDENGDGKIADPENDLGEISGAVLIYSAGPDGDFKTWNDNVCSWK